MGLSIESRPTWLDASSTNFSQKTAEKLVGKVELLTLSYFNSRFFKTVVTEFVFSATLLGMAYSCLYPDWKIGGAYLTLLAAQTLATVAFHRKELMYEASLLYTILGRKDWWSPIDKNLVVGAIPLEQHLDELKKLGVTHVLTLLEPFELQTGLAHPVSPEQWYAHGISHKMIETADFLGVPAHKLKEAATYLQNVLKENPDAIIYIHCKAGRGRSVSVVVAHKIFNLLAEKTSDLNNDNNTLDALLTEQINELKKKRPQINLNAHQRGTIFEAISQPNASVKAN